MQLSILDGGYYTIHRTTSNKITLVLYIFCEYLLNGRKNTTIFRLGEIYSRLFCR